MLVPDDCTDSGDLGQSLLDAENDTIFSDCVSVLAHTELVVARRLYSHSHLDPDR